jgi:hypothetical protein
MKTKALKMVRQLFAVDHTQRHNQRQWVKSVRQLGDRWLLAKPLDVQKKH